MPLRSENPLVSIIVACFNQEKFVGEALEGILAQAYSPLEIVIFDDCSSDRTADIIESKLASRPDRSDIRFVRNVKNMTGPVVCVTGLNMTHGEFVLITCGDDVMLPGMVETMAEVWRGQNVSLVTTNAYYIDAEFNSLNRTFRDPSTRSDDSFETLARDGSNACCFGPAIGFEREIYTTFGWIPEILEAYDIIYPFFAYLLKGARFIEKPLLKYRVHEENTSLSLILEKSDHIAELVTLERIFNGHLNHAVLMQDELRRLSELKPARYHELARKIAPLLTIQTTEMARKLVRTRIQLEKLRRGS